MNIAVVVRQVPDLIEPLEIDSSGAALDLGSASFIVNESDDHALEQAILLKEAGGATVSVVALDFGDVDNTLYTAAAKGADRIVKLTLDGEAPPSPRAAAALFAAALKPLSPDLVLIGVQAHDELDGGLSPFLAAALGLPYVGVIRGVQAGPEPGTVTVCKEFPGAVMARLKVKLPAVLGIVGAEQPPRYVPVAEDPRGDEVDAVRGAGGRGSRGDASAFHLPPGTAGLRKPCRNAHRFGRRSRRTDRRDSCRERTGEMSAQDVLVLAEVQREVLADVSLELLTAARGLAVQTGGQVVALVLSPDGAGFTPALGGADRIVLMDDPQLAGYSPEPFLAALQEVVAAEQPGIVLIGATSIGWDLAPLLAARLDLPLVTGCKAIEAEGGGFRVTAVVLRWEDDG